MRWKASVHARHQLPYRDGSVERGHAERVSMLGGMLGIEAGRSSVDMRAHRSVGRRRDANLSLVNVGKVLVHVMHIDVTRSC